MKLWPFAPSRAQTDAARLLGAVIQASRQPAFFGEGRAADTLQGRLELLTLHASLALIRVKREAALEPLAQAFVDQLFSHLDAGLREAGVGDLAVPKRMRKIAGDFQGRMHAYAAALEAGDAVLLADALARNIGVPRAFAERLAAYVAHLATTQANADFSALFDDGGWEGVAP